MKMDIDLVYLWVDGNDSEWRKKRDAFLGKIDENTEATCKGRYINNDELKYSLRSVEKYAPWIRRIFIVTDNQIPDWLDTTHSKINIIDHKDILPETVLPCFNSRIIESCLYKIPGLSERFLLANDDMFFNANTSADFFFSKDGFPIVRQKKKNCGKLRYWWKNLRGNVGNYRAVTHRAAALVEKKFGVYYSGYPHHNIDAFFKPDFREAIEHVFCEDVEKMRTSRTRANSDVSRHAVLCYALAIGHGHLNYSERDVSLTIHVQKTDYMKTLRRYQPQLFCLNDNERTKDEDRDRIKPFLQTLFPEKSAFEK